MTDKATYIECSCGDMSHMLRVEQLDDDGTEPLAEVEMVFNPFRNMPLRWRLRTAWIILLGRFSESPYFVLLERSQMLRLRDTLDRIIWGIE